MTAKRAAAYSGGGMLLLAWLASAAGLVVRQTPAGVEQEKPVETSGALSLAADVQAQTSRLKNRLAAAPVPQKPSRNPFSFAPRDVPARRRAPAASSPVAETLLPAEPAIDLVGVAENREADKLVRTAIISALSGELFLVKEGELIVGRYRVKTVGADVVELIDLLSGGSRQLTLRD